MDAVDTIVLGLYATLAVELVLFPIPSEASARQLLAARGDGGATGALATARRLALPRKLLVYLLPPVVMVALFCVPLLAIVVPDLRGALGVPHERAAAAAAVGLWCGLGLALLGRAVTFGSVLQLRALQRDGGEPRGLFRWSRNPGLLGMFAFFAGLCVLYGSAPMWIGLPLYVASMSHRVRLEESHQEQRLGEAWRDYAARVPRWIGRPSW